MPGVLKALINGAWVNLPAGMDEVWISPTEPTNPGIELWYDTDEVGITAARGLVGTPSMCRGTASSWTNNSSTATAITVTAGQAPSITATLDPTRWYKATFICQVSSSVAADTWVPEFRVDGNVLQNAAFPGSLGFWTSMFVFQPSNALAHTYSMWGRRSAASTGTMTISAATTTPISFYIEDVGT